jgi:TPP-dependent 2-oxoacid decarboxylase
MQVRLAIAALSTAFLIGSLTAAEVTGGSYQQTCNSIKLNGENLIR